MWKQNKLRHYQDDFLIRTSELVSAGFTQYEAVNFLLSQYEGIKQQVKEDCLKKLEEGEDFSSLLELLRYPKSITLQIYFSEQYGDINQTLKECHIFSVSKKENTQKLIKTIQYPLILCVIFFALIIIVNMTVLPQFKNMYDSMGVELSPELLFMTNVLFNLPKVLVGSGIILALLVVLYFFIYHKGTIDRKIWLIKKIPVLSKVHRRYITYRVSMELSFFISNGVAMLKIIEIFKDQEKDVLLKYIGDIINDELLKGHSLPSAVREVNLFEPSMVSFIAHGEKNSRLDVELKIYSEYIMKKLEHQLSKYIKWIQPVIFSALGLMIVTLYLVIILPMLQMMSGIQ